MNQRPIIEPELRAALKRLKLGHIAQMLPDRIVLADKQDMSFQELFLLVLTDEIDRRDNSAATRRAADAGLEPDMRFERWDKSANVSFDKRLLSELTSLRFVNADRNLVVLGPVGVGKTFIANGLGHLACRYGYNVLFRRADQMLKALRQSRFDNSRDAVMIELCTVDLLIIDDFAIEPMSRDESRDVYQLFIERTGHASTIITSNRDTAEWIAMFDDVLQAQSAVDRFINAAYDLVIDGESYRPKLKPQLDDNDPPPKLPVAKDRLAAQRRTKERAARLRGPKARRR